MLSSMHPVTSLNKIVYLSNESKLKLTTLFVITIILCILQLRLRFHIKYLRHIWRLSYPSILLLIRTHLLHISKQEY